MPLIDVVAGARPNFMKIAPIIRALEARKAEGGSLAYRLVHTGQHYDPRMSGDFFSQLGIPEPDINFEVGSGSHAEQIAQIMRKYEQLLAGEKPDLCLVVGDVTSTMACAVTAQINRVKVAHVEAGIRSGDWTMPEEINRIVTDSITNYFFTTTEFANDTLRKAGVDDDRIFLVGNTMIDTLLHNADKLRQPSFWKELSLSPGRYILITLHRPSNVDVSDTLTPLLDAIGSGVRDLDVVFPVHPRTRKTLQNVATLPKNIRLVEPQPYLEFIYLLKHCKAVITDSGGITEEATVLGIPCMTLRDTTERPETVSLGTNQLVGGDPDKLASALASVFAGGWKQGRIPDKWDGRTGARIVEHLGNLLGGGTDR